MSTPPSLQDAPFSLAEIAAEGIKPDEYQMIVDRLGRHPNRAELGMFGVMWSEHCCYKNSRPLLKQFPTSGDRILVGPGENAGVIDAGDGLRVAFKIESHNHPSAIEPFQGAATGVGGILRDIFTMGARPIAILNSLRFGNLENAKTRRLVAGVVEGISHYGNCLIESETLIWRDKQGVHVDTIGNFANQHLPEGHDTHELDQGDRLEALSFNPKTGKACWQPIKRLFKRATETLVTLKTPMGRKITITPDHPTSIVTDYGWETKAAQDVQKGDRLPILLDFPYTDNPVETIDCIHILQTQPNQHQQDVFVQLPKTWQPTEALRKALLNLEPSACKRHRYLSQCYFPLGQFLQVESLLNLKREDLHLYKRSGKANYMKAVIRCDETFARLIGYYLSEGCVSQNGNTSKIIFTFAPHEREYLSDVEQALRDLGLKPCIEERVSTTVVYATSWLLGWLFSEVWQCGQGAANKKMPDFVFQWYKILQREVLKGLIRGDGSCSNQSKGNHAKITYATTSDRLFRQVILLLQDLGIVPYTYLRPARSGEIQGRNYQGLPLWQLEICNVHDLTILRGIFSEERNALLDEALAKYEGNTHSFPRYKVDQNIASIAVKAIEVQTVEPTFVYDIEVENTHLFVTTSGFITHNCVGVPTVGGEVYFDPAYAENPLVNAMAIGLMETPEIVKSGAAGIGNPVLYVGSTTGRDGMGGASFASAELSDESLDDRPAVQVGDPFLEKSLIEACLEAFQTGAVVAAQDMGAAGLTCSTSEMAAKGGVGIDLDLDRIPVRETGMVPYEYLLSESQERMLFVAQTGREQELIEIFERWGLHAVVAGEVIAEPIVRIRWQGNIAAEIPASALADNTPLYHRQLPDEPPAYAQTAWQWTQEALAPCTVQGIDRLAGKTANDSHKDAATWKDVLIALLDTPSIASKQWIYRQYDHQVQNNTVLMPGGSDAAVIRLRDQIQLPKPDSLWKGIAATTDCNPRYVYLNPYEGAKMAVAEAARNLSCVGAEPLAVTDNLNFGSPEKPTGYWQLAEACRGISEACQEFATPVTGGNVSLYNETLDSAGNPQPIYPTPVIGMVGLIPDIRRVCGQGWQAIGDLIYLLGEPLTSPAPSISFGGSEYLAQLHKTVAGQPPIVDYRLEKQVQSACRQGIRQGWVRSAHDCAEGGFAVALAEACLAGDRGALLTLPAIPADLRWDWVLFAEGGARIVVSVSRQDQQTWETFLQSELAGFWSCVGKVVAAKSGLTLNTATGQSLIITTLEEMSNRFEGAIDRAMARQS